MAGRRFVHGSLVAAVVLVCGPRALRAQAPTLPPGGASQPGSTASRMGPTPGAGGSPFGYLPGAGDMILGGGRPGPSFPRVPASISTPAVSGAAPPRPRGIAAPQPLPITNLGIYGTLALPSGAVDEGPADGLTLDQAIDRVVWCNLDLQSKFFEVPQARADVLTAGLRANPIFYGDGQLVPYGNYAHKQMSGGPTQYDDNVSHPIDVSRKRPARVVASERALNVLEAQYQNAVRLQINNVYIAYIDVLAARETLRFAEASVEGLNRMLEVTEALHQRADVTRPDVVRVKIQKEAAEMGVQEARQMVQSTKRSLAVLLSMPPGQADTLELRGTIARLAPPIDRPEAFVSQALAVRPDLIAQRLDVRRAEADVKLAHANKFADIYLLYQPYTFQSNVPFGLKSPTSWALGVTVPVPLYNRNQGGVLRAGLAVTQAQIGSGALEYEIANEVTQAARECVLSAELVKHYEESVLPAARRMRDDGLNMFRQGETDALAYFRFQRDYNLAVRHYRDTLVRHRRGTLALNTAVGQRILP